MRSKFALLGLLACLVLSAGADSGDAAAGAEISVVGGDSTAIENWPWQVALMQPRKYIGNLESLYRFRCGGSLLAPTVVLTAAHCVQQSGTFIPPKKIAAIGGQTELRDDTPEVAVETILLPTLKNGRPRDFDRNRSWDLALLRLAKPVTGSPIKLLGPDEAALAAPGRNVDMTGWGSDRRNRSLHDLTLRHIRTVIQPDRVCRDFFELPSPFDPGSQACVADPSTDSIPCAGDSGGPAVIETSDGYRLVGVASAGNVAGCFTWNPLINTDVAWEGTRNWIAAAVRSWTGIDPVGSGATAAPVGEYCQLPRRILGRKLSRARKAVRDGGCTVGTVRRRSVRGPRRAPPGTVLSVNGAGSSLRDPANPVDMVVARPRL